MAIKFLKNMLFLSLAIVLIWFNPTSIWVLLDQLLFEVVIKFDLGLQWKGNCIYKLHLQVITSIPHEMMKMTHLSLIWWAFTAQNPCLAQSWAAILLWMRWLRTENLNYVHITNRVCITNQVCIKIQIHTKIQICALTANPHIYPTVDIWTKPWI